MTKVRMEKQINFRLDPEQQAELNDLAERYNVNPSKIIRMALELFISVENKYRLIKGEAAKRTMDIKNFVDELAMFFSASK